MPLYEYTCSACGHRFEQIRSMAERNNANCPKCGAQSDKRLSTFAAVNGSCCSSETDSCSSSGSCCSGGSCGCGG